MSLVLRAAALSIMFFALSGCAVIAVTGAAVGAVATGAGLAVDAATLGVKAVGAVGSAVIPGGSQEQK